MYVADHSRMAQRQQIRAERVRNHGVRFRHRAQPLGWPQISPGEPPQLVIRCVGGVSTRPQLYVVARRETAQQLQRAALTTAKRVQLGMSDNNAHLCWPLIS